MTYDEALTEAVSGARVRPDCWQPGVYVEHSFSRGFLKCWPVDRVEDEPNRTQCDFRVTAEDEAAAWTEIVRPEPVPQPRAIDLQAFGRGLRPIPATVGWGKPLTLDSGTLDETMKARFTKGEPGGVIGVPKSVKVLRDGVWTNAVEAPSKWGSQPPKKEPGKWGN